MSAVRTGGEEVRYPKSIHGFFSLASRLPVLIREKPHHPAKSLTAETVVGNPETPHEYPSRSQNSSHSTPSWPATAPSWHLIPWTPSARLTPSRSDTQMQIRRPRPRPRASTTFLPVEWNWIALFCSSTATCAPSGDWPMGREGPKVDWMKAWVAGAEWTSRLMLCRAVGGRGGRKGVEGCWGVGVGILSGVFMGNGEIVLVESLVFGLVGSQCGWCVDLVVSGLSSRGMGNSGTSYTGFGPGLNQKVLRIHLTFYLVPYILLCQGTK